MPHGRRNKWLWGFLLQSIPAGPWKGVSDEGRARRGLSVIMAQKIDVNVNAIGHLGIYGQTGQNGRS